MRKRCKRKVRALVNPIAYATEGAAITDGEPLALLRSNERAAIEAVRSGAATLADLREIEGMARITRVMAGAGVGPEALVSALAAEVEVRLMRERLEQGGRAVATGPGLRAIMDAQEYHDLQRTSISRGEYERWILKTINLEKAGVL